VINCLESKCQSKVFHHFIQFTDVQILIIPLHTIGRFFAATIIQKSDQLLIVFTLLCFVIQTLVILNPKGYIPSLIIRPTVVAVVSEVGLKGGCHLVIDVLHYRGTLEVTNFNCQDVRLML